MLKVSIITVTFNSAETLQDTINSVAKQDYDNIEYIIIDGASNDETVNIIKRNSSKVTNWISEPDKGLYDAMNKGIKIATGDIVGILNSDDFYNKSDAITKIVNEFQKNDVNCVFADVRFVHPENLDKTVRYYSSKSFKLNSFSWGKMPAHTTFFTYKKNFEKHGYYKTNYKIASDFELLARFLFRHKLSYKYLDYDLIKMRLGGISTKSIKSNYLINKEIVRACKENEIRTSFFKVYLKYSIKIFEFVFTRNE